MTQEAIEEQQVANPEAVVAESEAAPAPPDVSAESETQAVASPETQPASTETAELSTTETPPSEPAPIQAPQSLPGDLQRIQQAESRAIAAEQRVQQAELGAADQQANSHFMDEAQRMQAAQIDKGVDAQVATDAANQLYNSRMGQWNAFLAQRQVQQQVPQLQELMGQRVATVLQAAKQHSIEPLDLFNATKQMDGTQIAGHAAQMSEMTKMRAEIATLKTGQANANVPANQTFANTNGAGTLSDEAFTNYMADPNSNLSDADFKRWNDMGKSG